MAVVHHIGQQPSAVERPHITPGYFRPILAGSEGPAILDPIYEQLVTAIDGESVDRLHPALESLFLHLHQTKSEMAKEDWNRFVADCRRHPLRAVLHEDPFTRRAFVKPRGYAGDAELLDYIYGREEFWAPPAASELGHHIFSFTTLAPAAEGVRARRGFIADLLDELADDISRPHVLSIAAGHLREASISAALRRRKFGRFVAMDADRHSLDLVRQAYGMLGIDTYPANIRRLLTKRVDLGQFDLVYSTGLFDYLEQSTGRRMVSSMFDMLRPGGRLVVANYLPGIRDVGFMETFMDWRLIYRTRYDMVDLTMEIEQSQIGDIRLFADESRNILFLQVTREK